MTLHPLTVQTIHDLVRSGKMTPVEGASLLRRIEYARKPRWERALRFVARLVFG